MTICARDRACLFGEIADGEPQVNSIGALVDACWRQIPAHFPGVELDAFVVMPNHVHGILLFVGGGHARPLPVVVGSFKAAVSKQMGFSVWQRNYYEHIIRGEDELNSIRHYIDDSPLNWPTDTENPACDGVRRA